MYLHLFLYLHLYLHLYLYLYPVEACDAEYAAHRRRIRGTLGSSAAFEVTEATTLAQLEEALRTADDEEGAIAPAGSGNAGPPQWALKFYLAELQERAGSGRGAEGAGDGGDDERRKKKRKRHRGDREGLGEGSESESGDDERRRDKKKDKRHRHRHRHGEREDKEDNDDGARAEEGAPAGPADV